MVSEHFATRRLLLFSWCRLNRDTIKAWVLRYSDNGVRSFGADEYDDALEFFNSELAINRVIDKHGVVAAWVDNKPAGYVPNSRGLVLAATPSIPAPAPLANPY